MGQTPPEVPLYSRVNTLGVFGAYSGDSSHMVLGYAQNRKLLDIGVAYNRRLRLGSIVSWQYSAELLPVALESDPVTHYVLNQQTPTPGVLVSDFRQVAACVANSASYGHASEWRNVQWNCNDYLQADVDCRRSIFSGRSSMEFPATTEAATGRDWAWRIHVQHAGDSDRRCGIIQFHIRPRCRLGVLSVEQPVDPRRLSLSPYLESRHCQ